MSQDYDDGYSAGKAKALFECAIATCHMSTTPECRCSPCTALRYAIHSLSEGEPGPAAPAPKLGLCRECGHPGAEVPHRRAGLLLPWVLVQAGLQALPRIP